MFVIFVDVCLKVHQQRVLLNVHQFVEWLLRFKQLHIILLQCIRNFRMF